MGLHSVIFGVYGCYGYDVSFDRESWNEGLHSVWEQILNFSEVFVGLLRFL